MVRTGSSQRCLWQLYKRLHQGNGNIMICLEEVGKTDASPRKKDLYFVCARNWPSSQASYNDTTKLGKCGCSVSKLIKLNNGAFFLFFLFCVCVWHNYVSHCGFDMFT